MWVGHIDRDLSYGIIIGSKICKAVGVARRVDETLNANDHLINIRDARSVYQVRRTPVSAVLKT